MADDVLLLKQMHEGNAHAFDLLYEKYWASAYSIAYKRLKDHEQVKDIVQEIFIYIWTKKDSLQIVNFPAYINIAIRNKVYKYVEKQKDASPFLDILENLPATYLQADSNLLWKEFFKSYEIILDSLPPQRRAIFQMRFQDDLPAGDIAHQLGLSKKTVQNQLSMAFEQIRVSLIHLFILAIILNKGPF